jgi:hypothetical protein
MLIMLLLGVGADGRARPTPGPHVSGNARTAGYPHRFDEGSGGATDGDIRHSKGLRRTDSGE